MAEEPPIEEGFSTFEMRASRRGTMKSQRGTIKSTTSRKSSNLAMINSSRNPPRPTPGLVNYSDEDSGKGYDENPDDSDSLTEKPSEISSTDSQVGFHSFSFSVFPSNFLSVSLIFKPPSSPPLPPPLPLLGDLPAGHRVGQRRSWQRPPLLRQPLRQRQQHLQAELEEAEADPAASAFKTPGSGRQRLQFLH